MTADRAAARLELLRIAGAEGPVADELLAYGESPFDPRQAAGLHLPLTDEPHLDVWSEYAADAETEGVIPSLARRLVQLRFPIEAGISATETYRAATRRGVIPDGGVGLALLAPEEITLDLYHSPAGRVPVLLASARADFVALLRAFSARNEPEAVPDSMGACIVNGLNNWDRVARYRRRFEADRGISDDAAAWAAEFPRFAARKELYQDRFIILSRGPYSAVPAEAVGLAEEEWTARSVAIRRSHECTHYLTLRVFGQMRNNLLDELAADAAGLLAATGTYDAGLALRFLGLEDYPRFRATGRLANYLGQPRLSDPAIAVLESIVVGAVHNIEAWVRRVRPVGATAVGRVVLALLGLTLEELASEQMIGLADRAMETLEAPPASQLTG